MKNILFTLVFLFSISAFAQNFEGTIKWNIKMDITDPALKAQMEANKDKANDPANQEKMKAMQKQMEDPQMKKMLESNPQMKAQMEKMMAMQQSGNMDSMFPTSMLMKFKGGNTVTSTEGGMMSSEVLYLKEKNVSFMIDRQNKTFSPLPPSKPETAKPLETKVTKTKETAKILNYTCTKYTAEVTHEGKTMTQTFWTTTEIKDVDFKSMANQRMERGKQLFYENIEGFPLRVEIDYPEMKARMVMEVSEIKKQILKAEEFSIPPDYKNIPPPPGQMR